MAFALWRATIRPTRNAAILLKTLFKTLSSSTPFSNHTVAVRNSTRFNNLTVDEQGWARCLMLKNERDCGVFLA